MRRTACLLLAAFAALLDLLAPASCARTGRLSGADRSRWSCRFRAGGPTDIIARIVASTLQQSLGQNVIIDNRGGAGGNIGIAYVARANPDGYTLLFTSTAIAVNPGLFANLPYDPIKDFAPISELVNAPNVLFVRPDSGINSIADLVARAKAEPNTFNYASPGRRHQVAPDRRTAEAARRDRHPAHPLSRRRTGDAGAGVGHGPACIGRARAGRAADQVRHGAGAGGHRRDALVLAAGRADHDRVRLSRLCLRHLQRAVRAGRHAARDRRLAGQARCGRR